jgi:hypothetical protein
VKNNSDVIDANRYLLFEPTTKKRPREAIAKAARDMAVQSWAAIP